jgi:hypothetical protein
MGKCKLNQRERLDRILYVTGRYRSYAARYWNIQIIFWTLEEDTDHILNTSVEEDTDHILHATGRY